MKHELKRIENSAVEIKICLDAEEVKGLKEAAVKKVAKEVEVPGFRKGKVPAKTVEAQFQPAIKEEVVEATLQKYYEEVIKAENLRPISPITSLKADLNEELEVVFTLDIFPEIKLGTYKGLEVEKETFQMTDERLEDEIKMMLNSKSKLEDTEAGHKAEMGDTVDLAFEGFVDGVAFEGGKSDSHSLKLGSKMFIDTFEEQLVGYTQGQEGEVNVTFPTEYHSKELAGKPAVFKVKVNSIKKLVTPELNDELAKEFGFENVEDLKTKTRENIVAREENRIKNEFIGKLLEKVADTTEIAIPMSMLKNEIGMKIAEMEQQLASQGIGMDMYLKMTGMDRKTLESQVAPMVTGKIKADLILGAIADAEKLDATEEEMTAKMTEVAKMYGMDLETLESKLKEYNNLDNFKANIKVDVLVQKAVDVLVNNAK